MSDNTANPSPAIEAVPTDSGPAGPLLVDATTAAKLLAVSPRTLWTLTFKLKAIPVVKIGALTRYRLRDLEEFCEREAHKPREPEGNDMSE